MNYPWDALGIIGFFMVIFFFLLLISIKQSRDRAREERLLARLDKLKRERAQLYIPVQQAYDRLGSIHLKPHERVLGAPRKVRNRQRKRLAEEYDAALRAYKERLSPLIDEQLTIERKLGIRAYAETPMMSDEDAILATQTMMALGGMMSSHDNPFHPEH